MRAAVDPRTSANRPCQVLDRVFDGSQGSQGSGEGSVDIFCGQPLSQLDASFEIRSNRGLDASLIR